LEILTQSKLHSFILKNHDKSFEQVFKKNAFSTSSTTNIKTKRKKKRKKEDKHYKLRNGKNKVHDKRNNLYWFIYSQKWIATRFDNVI